MRKRLLFALLAVLFLYFGRTDESFARNQAFDFGKIHEFPTRIESVLRDGEQYIAVIHDGRVISSKDGIRWDTSSTNIFNPVYIVRGKDQYLIMGGLARSDKSKDVNSVSFGRSHYDFAIATSADGVHWESWSGEIVQKTVDAPGFVSHGFIPRAKVYYIHNQYIYLMGDKTYFSTDGRVFKGEEVIVRDPYKLTPKGYNYLGQNGSYDPINLGYDGEMFYSFQTDYFGTSILRSKDAIHWDIVYFNKEHFRHSNFVVTKGKYVSVWRDTVIQSEDGLKWTVRNLNNPELADRLLRDTPPMADPYVKSPDIYYFNGYFYLKSGNYKTEDNFIYLTKDFRTYHRFSFENMDYSPFLLIDENFIVTGYGIYDNSKLFELMKYEHLQKPISLMIDGQSRNYPRMPVVEDGTILVPMRNLLADLGAKVEWNPDTKTVAARKDQIELKFTIGDRILYVNGMNVQLHVPARVVDGTTYIPLRAISEAFELKVEWDKIEQTVIISSK